MHWKLAYQSKGTVKTYVHSESKWTDDNLLLKNTPAAVPAEDHSLITQPSGGLSLMSWKYRPLWARCLIRQTAMWTNWSGIWGNHFIYLSRPLSLPVSEFINILAARQRPDVNQQADYVQPWEEKPRACMCHKVWNPSCAHTQPYSPTHTGEPCARPSR